MKPFDVDAYFGQPDTPNSPEVHPDTLEALRRAMQDLSSLGTAGTSKNPELNDLQFCNSRVELVDGPGFAFAGSGQIVGDPEVSEYVIWTRTESNLQPTWNIAGQAVRPLGYIHELKDDPSESDKVLSRQVITTLEGTVWEVGEGEYLSDDPVTIRTLADHEVQALLSDMAKTATTIRIQRTAGAAGLHGAE
jgi:hypothetical protein